LTEFSRSTCKARSPSEYSPGTARIDTAIMGVDLGISLFTSAGILLFLSLLAVTLRCITRIYIVKAFGLDDWLMIVAMVRTPVPTSTEVDADHVLRHSTLITVLGSSLEEVWIKVGLTMRFHFQILLRPCKHSISPKIPSKFRLDF
jgi:hypothetical protein